MKANPRGKEGEDYAAGMLADAGYIILARNFSSRFGEIDIVAEKDGVIAFVEVKARRKNSMVSGFEAVTPAKMRKIILTARVYLMTRGKDSDLQPRFDVVSVTSDGGRITGCDHLEGAFDAYE